MKGKFKVMVNKSQQSEQAPLI